ncbi:metallophosphoesterase family protein [Kitasatospora sp. NBC_01287]|uniref:purple acid phosphatase family protein n=1 Tax=Kitasatospora sp. NBC_01287 TaxID=2903573 RepID=UPI00224FA23A|nr:metallophosphoesterase family protein [Kitasatospora sp. NBC_01287]MCX4749945.1 metallophosphoesterase family protein [Kitasatospora sp. NBC_01287]
MDQPFDAPEQSGDGTLSRRTALRLTATVGGAALAAGPLLGATPAVADDGSGGGASTQGAGSPLLLTRPESLGAPPVEGLHLTFGADPTRQMTASWSTEGPVRNPRVQLGTLEGGFGRTVQAETRTYTDGASNRVVYTHHARMENLRPGTYYTYAALHDGGRPDAGTFRTAQRGRQAFTFTSFGDQSVPDTTWQPDGKGGFTAVANGIASPAAADIVGGIEQVDPLFHLLNGDLCYANITPDRLRTWQGFFANNTRSARYRPWMPAAGNHENEKANGPIGFSSFQTRFDLPGNGGDEETEGLWYSFTVGSVHVVVLQNDDVAYQDAGDTYVYGYSGGAQRAWLEQDLRQARSDKSIDWVVVCMHQVVISSSDANGADRGIREQWGPLFDRYQVDLVVCGHEHDYERSLPVRGTISGSETLTPNPVSTATDVMDTSRGTVHMVLGGGGNSSTSNGKFFAPAKAKVITGVGPVGSNGKRTPIYVNEEAPWVGVRDVEHSYGFAAFTVDPGTRPGGTTSIHVTYYTVAQPDGSINPLETFVLQRKRSDTH